MKKYPIAIFHCDKNIYFVWEEKEKKLVSLNNCKNKYEVVCAKEVDNTKELCSENGSVIQISAMFYSFITIKLKNGNEHTIKDSHGDLYALVANNGKTIIFK